MDPPDATGWSQLLTYIGLTNAAGQRLRRERPDRFSRASPHRPLDIGRSQAGPHTRFGKRQNEHFTISYQFDLLLLFLRLPLRLKLLSPRVRARRMCCPRAWPTRSLAFLLARDSGDIGMPPLSQLTEPETSRILLADYFTERRASAMDHQCAHVAIAAFAAPAVTHQKRSLGCSLPSYVAPG